MHYEVICDVEPSMSHAIGRQQCVDEGIPPLSLVSDGDVVAVWSATGRRGDASLHRVQSGRRPCDEGHLGPPQTRHRRVGVYQPVYLWGKL